MDKKVPQVASLRLLTTEDRVRFPDVTCVICGGQSGTNAGFSSTTFLRQWQFQFYLRYKVTHTSFDKLSADTMKTHILQRLNSPSMRIIKYALSNATQDFLSLSIFF